MPLEILLDSSSSISSISEHAMKKLALDAFPAPPIPVLFGDNQRPYHSSTRAYCTFILAQSTFSYDFYVLPRQLFPITLGCDWFLRTRAKLNFNLKEFILPTTQPIPIFVSTEDFPSIVNTQVAAPDPHSRRQDLQSLLRRFPHLFSPAKETGKINFPVSHAINTGDAQPIRMASRRRSPLEHDRINRAVQDMLHNNIIKPSESDWVSEPHLVRKDDGSYRFCIDFRLLNQVTVHDRLPTTKH